MSLSIKKKSRLYARYLRSIEKPDAFLCILDAMLGRMRLRQIRLAGTSLFVRSGTLDVKVAISSLVEQEHRDVKCDDPRFIIDAGANIGSASIYFARRFPNARIIAVEPEKDNFEMLCKNAEPYPNIVPIQAALWSERTMREIQDRHTGSLGFTISETTNRKQATGQKVDCLTIQDLMEQHGIDRIDLLKMDIEGAEKEVLGNSDGWINKVNALTAELHDKICPGCERAYYLATKDFKQTIKYGEKIIAYRI